MNKCNLSGDVIPTPPAGFAQKNLNAVAVYNFDEMAEYATGDGYIAALIAAQCRPRDRENSTRIGCPLPPNTTISKDKDIQDAAPQPPSYDTLYIQPRVPVISELNGNLLWQLVENDLRRDVNVDDPLKGARRLGRKLIAAMYFPLLNDGVRFTSDHSVCHYGALVSGGVADYDKNLTKMCNCSDAINYTCIGTTTVATAEVVLFATIIAFIDCIACTSYFLHRKCCKHPQTAPEEQPLLGVKVRWVQWSAIANWWHKYSDIPRFKVFEALYIVIYYLAFASRNDNIPLSITVVAASLYSATLLLQVV